MTQETNTLPAEVLEEMARTAYENWIDDVRDLEPAWGELDDTGHQERLEAAMQAAWKASPGPRLAEALRWFLGQKASFDAMNGDQAAAYYHFVKQDKAWAEVHAALSLLAPDERATGGEWRADLNLVGQVAGPPIAHYCRTNEDASLIADLVNWFRSLIQKGPSDA
jgi:hypothetical protein